MSHWKISRAGVVNFWYYDEEYFQFEDGRLLLRGANGSGKSVTMQSLVPLLFDGNKSPERLDPFGSKARRMESYLLSDGLELEERTGYLFLEFEKSSTNTFLTIGMGLRARKNQPLQSWYFIILDGRRIGPGLDFSLYKDLGEKIPFTQKELENRIGLGGKLYTSQKEYQSGVNEHLFGFADVEEYEELIKLLIQLRSPKLSKEFKPTTMYEIMQNSLQTLTDEDLRPMSESIESMDEIKTKLEQLEISRQSIDRISTAYNKYNLFQLAHKAQLWLKGYDQRSKWLIEINDQEQLFSENEIELKHFSEWLTTLSLEETDLREKAASLQQHDFAKLLEEQHILENRLSENQKKLLDKTEQLNRHKQKERQLQSQVKESSYNQERLKTSLLNHLLTMADESTQAVFDEHAFFEAEFTSQMDQDYNFDYLDLQYKKHMALLKRGQTLLGELQVLEKSHDDALAELSDSRYSKERQEKKLLETVRQFAEIKDEYVEKLFAWHGKLKEITIPRSTISIAAEKAQSFGEPFFYDDLMMPVRTDMQASISLVRQQLNTEMFKLNQLKDSLKVIIDELEDLKNTKDIEPPRSVNVQKNRERLDLLKIPYMPLYKAIDFHEDMAEPLKGHLEEALLELGLLDALIVSPEHQSVVLGDEVGHADKYIFTTPELFSYNVGQYISVEKNLEAFSPQLVDDVLKSLFLDEATEKTYITEQGHYGMGLLRGKTSGVYNPIFVGFQSRKRHKEYELERLQDLIRQRKLEIDIVTELVATLNTHIEAAEKSLLDFPKTSDLEVALREVGVESSELNRWTKVVETKSILVEQVFESLKLKRIEVQESIRKIALSPQKLIFDEAIDCLTHYQELLMILKLIYKDYQNLKNQLISQEEQYESILQLIEEASSDVFGYEKQIHQQVNRLESIKDQFQLDDFKEVQMLLTETLKRLDQLPKDMGNAMEGQAKSRAAIESMTLKRMDLDMELKKSNAKLALFTQGLSEELALGYIIPESEMSIWHSSTQLIDPNLLETQKSIVDGILKIHGGILEEKKQLQELRDDLQERLLKESGQLAEYSLKRVERFIDLTDWIEIHLISDDGALKDELFERALEMRRIDIVGRLSGREVKFSELSVLIAQRIEENKLLFDEQDRELFEEILIKSISRKISARIWHSEQWVYKINQLMESMNTSSGLTFHLKWETQKSIHEDQLSTEELVKFLKTDQGLLSHENRERMIRHFRSKIQESRNKASEMTELSSFLTLMKEILDYRKWFEFKLFFTKKGDKRKEMTNNAFFTFSGGEKAMAMYVPLFSAVYAKYQAGKSDCPRIVSLDEAFAGVDEKNIRDMFRLLVELDLNFVANSQVLYGDYDTVPALSIYELIRPENVTFVTSLRYKWNGIERELVTDEA